MPLIIIIVVLLTSAILSAFFILRDAKSFAVAPPTPLLDLDRMYDYVFANLDETTGAKITPDELRTLINHFLKVFSDNQLIAEDLSGSVPGENRQFTLDELATAIKKLDPELNVPALEIKKVIELILAYLTDVGALT